MKFQIEDLVSFSDGIQGIVTSFKDENNIVVVPLDKGIPRICKESELTLVYSFLSELDKLTSDEELQAILSKSEELLKSRASLIKEKKTRNKADSSTDGTKEEVEM